MQIKYKGCDISHHQGIVDFKRLKDDVDFIIIKLGGSDKRNGGYYIDTRFAHYYKECKKYNIPVGCYWFAGKYSRGYARGFDEAEYVRRSIKELKFEYPIYIDFEYGENKYKKENTMFCKGFCEYLENNRYFVGIYSSDVNGFKLMLNNNELGAYSKWVARYGNVPSYVKKWDVWQYSSKGKLKGVSGNVDLDYSKVNFPKIMKNKHLNGW